MTDMGSSNHMPPSPQSEVSNSPGTPPPEPVAPDDPKFVEALGVIVSAFVDIGFGVSAAQHATQAANDNRDLIAIASEFHSELS